MQTRLRSSSNSQERRNSVSDITEFFQAKFSTEPPSMPLPSGRKTSGKAKDREKEKEREKELKTARENIKAYINKLDTPNANANGGEAAESAIRVDESVNHDEITTSHVDASENISPKANTNEEDSIDASNEKNGDIHTVNNSKATQTTEDEILKAIQELASKYQSIDDAVNDPKNGITAQLAKTNTTVNTLYTEIYGAVSGLKVQLNKITEEAKSNSEKIVQMEDSQKRMAALLEENKRMVQELRTMQGLVQKITQKSESNANQLLDLTKRGMEQNLIIHGVDNSLEVRDAKEENPMYTYKERCKFSALEFFKKELNLDLAIEDIWKAHRTGQYKKDKVRPLIVKVSYAAKDLIMEHIPKLKGRFNPITKQKYFVGEQIPEGITETRKQTSARLKPLKENNEKKPKENRDTIQVVGDKILINGEIHNPDVSTPTPSQLFLNSQEQKEVDTIQSKFVETDVEYFKNSDFSALAIKVHSIKEVKLAYIAAIQRCPATDHVMLGYALKEEGKLKTGFADDREFGAGPRIKNRIFEKKAKNTAVFVLRKFGGVHLGYQRFAVIERVADKAIDLLLSTYN